MIPLTCRSYFSLMWGTPSIEELCGAARRMGYTRLALTDTNSLCGLPAFLKNCARAGITPIVGAEVTDRATSVRAVCLVENAAGYRNLCQLLTERHQVEMFELCETLPRYAQGLTVLCGQVALLERWHAQGVTVAARVPRKPAGAFGALRALARRLGVPLVATPGSFFLKPEDHAVHRVLRAIDRNTSVSRLEAGDVAPRDAWLASPEEYARRFDVCPEAVQATHALAERCAFTGPETRTIFPAWSDGSGRTAAQALRADAYAGARWRYGDDLPETVVERLEHELRSIEAKGFADYFLVVRDIIGLNPRICGRGSAAASIVAYSLGITNVCPMKFNLYFERFLNPGRSDPPDIDVDFAWDERDALQLDVLKRYAGHAAMVCNHVLFQPRMALREVAKVYGLPDREIKRVTGRIPWFWHGDDAADDLQTGLAALTEMRSVEFPEPWPEILRIAAQVLGAPRYLSVHAGGVVITPRPIAEYVPIENAAKPVPIVQWEKDGAEEMGFVKIDLLGNRSLAVIRDAIANLKANGEAWDEDGWEPEDDECTQQAVARGDTMGCFYIESPAMRLLQQKTGRGDYEHLVIHSSIIRPAANDYIREYIRRLRGGAWEPFHPLLVDVLAESYGIMVYQEHVAQAAMALAGFDHASADRLRKVLSKKDKERELADYRMRFASGARERGVSPETVEAVWDMIMSFAGYSFCKPHSASYARVSFQAAFLKVHYPAEFMAAVISNQGGFYSAFAYVSEARRMGVTILPPDVNLSEVRWRGRDRTMRVGLLSLKDLGGETVQRIVDRRKPRPYASLTDFLDRVEPDEAEARALIRAGACDAFAPGRDRVELSWTLAEWLHRRRRVHAQPPRASLFGPAEDLRAPRLPTTTERERLRDEYEVLGFLCDRHPVALFERELERLQPVKARDLPHHAGKCVRMAGWLITGKVVHTKHGEPMEFLTFEDETGLIETTFFPRVYARFCDLLGQGGPFVFTGSAEEEFGAVTVVVGRVERLKLVRDPGQSSDLRWSVAQPSTTHRP
ncbi:MAG: DNA polymerase III subunit alpha [Planctomycetota bacterium]|nr:DNA polymerase III subunit alpha [Planctomycetota bacterium]